MSGLLLGWAGGGWTEGYSRLSLALRIQNLMKIHRHTLASIDPCTQIHPRPPAHTLSLAGSHTPARVPVYVPHTGKLIHYTPPHGPHTPFNTHVHPPPQLPTSDLEAEQHVESSPRASGARSPCPWSQHPRPDGYSISSEGFLPAVIDIMVI